ncbi:MAG: hypothetical protein Q7R95_10800 [bacterium]|nr:hypothetical protein [bacterium]
MTLTEVSFYTRKMLPFFILIFMVFLILIYSVKLFFAYLDASKPHVVYTNPIFNKITKPLLVDASSSAGLNFALDTIEGQPLTASEAAKVYLLPQVVARFGYAEKINLMAKTFGINTALIKYKMVDNDATFNDEKQKLIIDKTNFNFRYEYNFVKFPEVFTNTKIPSETEIQNKAIDFLKKIGRYPDELATGKSNIVYLNYDSSQTNFVVTSRPTEANVVEIDFYRPDMDGFSTVSPSYPNSQNYLVMAVNDAGMQVLRGQIRFFDKSTEQVGVYPLKTGDVAWEELKAGKGTIISGSKNITNVTIKNMFTAYFDPDVFQLYLQPVYVFLGSDNFAAIVPAVDDSFLTE